MQHITKTVKNIDLENKIVSFCADNVNTNFEGVRR